MAQEPLFDVSVVAKKLGVCGETVRSWIRAEKIAVVRTPTGRYKIPASEAARLRKTQDSQTTQTA